MAGKILKGEEKAENIPVKFTDKARLVMNEKTMNDLGIKLDKNVKVEFIK